MKVCVFGGGAIGSHFAARLVQGGAEVSVVARGAQLAAIRADGIRLEAADGAFQARVTASDRPAELGPQDAVLVAVKAPSLPSVAAAIGPLLGQGTPVAFLMNGIPWWYFHAHGGALDGRRLPLVDPDGALWRAIGPERAIGGVVYSACTVLRPGVVHVENSRSRLILGEPDGALSARAEALAAHLRGPGVAVEVSGRIRDEIWSKLLLNLTSIPFSVLTLAPPRALYTEPAVTEAAERIIDEAVAVAEALGCRPRHDAVALVGQYLKMAHKPSMLQDLELGRSMEIDALLEAPLALARLVDRPTPLLDLLVALVKVRARVAGLYPG